MKKTKDEYIILEDGIRRKIITYNKLKEIIEDFSNSEETRVLDLSASYFPFEITSKLFSIMQESKSYTNSKGLVKFS
jgi:hypothetical protein